MEDTPMPPKIDRKALRAFAGKDTEDEKKPMKGNPGGGEGGGDEEAQEGGEGKFSQLLPMLEEHVQDVIDCADEVDPDVLTSLGEDLMDDDRESLQDAFNGLDGKLKKEMKSALPDITEDQATELAEHLESEGMTDDPDKLAGLLFRWGQMFGKGQNEGGNEPGDEEEQPEGEGGEEEEFE